MTVIGVTHWTRRDQADRAMLGQTAFELCKALRASGAVDDARFYWTGPDDIVVQVTAGDPGPLLDPPNADCARGLFALGDLAGRTRFEQWLDPRTGLEHYTLAGR